MPYLTETQYASLMDKSVRDEKVIEKLKRAAGTASAYLIAKHNKVHLTITDEDLVELLDDAVLEKGI